MLDDSAMWLLFEERCRQLCEAEPTQRSARAPETDTRRPAPPAEPGTGPGGTAMVPADFRLSATGLPRLAEGYCCLLESATPS
jgi:hypothetical protein